MIDKENSEHKHNEMIIQLVSRASHQKKEQRRLFFFYSEAGIYCDFEKSQHGIAV